MSLFRKPKKHIQRRVFSANEDEEGCEQRMDVDEDEKSNMHFTQKAKKDKKDKTKAKQTLLSFDDEGR